MTRKINYGAHGHIFGRNMQAILGRLLYEERWKRRLTLAVLGNKMQMKPQKIENVELGRCQIHWGQIKRLLDFYGKEVIVNLVDVKEEEE